MAVRVHRMPLKPEQLHVAARHLRLEAAAAEAVAALRDAGIRPLLLKGPALGQWLFPEEPWLRIYGDVDLLVAPAAHDRASDVLEQLGYQRHSFADAAQAAADHAVSWSRPHGISANIDLHHRLYLMRAAPDTVWEILTEKPDVIEMGGLDVEVPTIDARTVLLVLHAAWHGGAAPKPMRDLQRALDVLEPGAWRRGADLAVRLGATEGFASGLRLDPRGAVLADALGLTSAASAEMRLRGASARSPAIALLRVLDEASSDRRLRMLAGEVIPPPDAIRSWHPFARRSRRALAATYVWRVAWIASQLPSAVRAVHGARRASSTG